MTNRDSAEPIVIYPSRWKLLAIGLGCLVLVAFALQQILAYRAATTHTPNATLVFLVSLCALPFFAAAGLFLLYRYLSPKPSLLVTADGIADHASSYIGGKGLIPWSDITAIECFTAPRRLANPRYLQITYRVSTSRRGQHTASPQGDDVTVLSLPQYMLAMPIDDLLRQLRSRYSTQIATHHISLQPAGDG
jgi:hypothetical protein